MILFGFGHVFSYAFLHENPVLCAKYVAKAFCTLLSAYRYAFDTYLMDKTGYSDESYTANHHMNNHADKNFSTKMHKRE